MACFVPVTQSLSISSVEAAGFCESRRARRRKRSCGAKRFRPGARMALMCRGTLGTSCIALLTVAQGCGPQAGNGWWRDDMNQGRGGGVFLSCKAVSWPWRVPSAPHRVDRTSNGKQQHVCER
jgi:hypothetical protein